MKNQPKLRAFVAIDSEGCNIGLPHSFATDLIDTDNISSTGNISTLLSDLYDATSHRLVQRHRTFLWGASDGISDEWLINEKKEPLSTYEILDFLTGLPGIYDKATYISYAFSYDVAQALAALPLSKLQKIQQKSHAYTLCMGFAIRYQRGKFLSIAKVRSEGGDELELEKSITIYDVFGFFQCSFLKAISRIPNVCSKEMLEIIEEGKAQRTEFDTVDITSIKRYTRAELHTLVAMMNSLRNTLEDMELRLKRWNGAGSVASAMLSKHNVSAHYAKIYTTDLPPQQTYAHHAYFGGRIECLKYGRTKNQCWIYDINSAYPHAQLTLPSMVGGAWKLLSEGEICEHDFWGYNPLSMIELVWTCKPFPFGPFPYRTKEGAIFYPLSGHGIYTVDEVLGAINARSKGMPLTLYYKSAYRFLEGSCVKPFNWIKDYYHLRRDIIMKHRNGEGAYDLTEYAIKLGLNASYGKLAQKVGGSEGKAPVTANPYYAAVITARTRARMLELAMYNPTAIISFATDGITSTVPLPVHCCSEKEIGAWEQSTIAGGLWVQSGVYWHYNQDGKILAKSRGISPAGLQSRLHDEILDAWEHGETSIDFLYRQYITVGTSIRSQQWRNIIGYWMSSLRILDLTPGRKRKCSGRGNPHQKLIATKPMQVVDSHVLSYPRIPDWVESPFHNFYEGEEAVSKFED